MSFELYRDARRTNPDLLTVALQVDRRHGAGLNIRMRAGIAARLGWEKGTKLVVHRGTGRDTGKIRLKRGTKFARQLYIDARERYQKGEAPFVLKVRAWPELGSTSKRAASCEWRIPADDLEALEIELPGWAR